MANGNGTADWKKTSIIIIQGLVFLLIGYGVSEIHQAQAESDMNGKSIAINSERIAKLEVFIRESEKAQDRVLEEIRLLRAAVETHHREESHRK